METIFYFARLLDFGVNLIPEVVFVFSEHIVSILTYYLPSLLLSQSIAQINIVFMHIFKCFQINMIVKSVLNCIVEQHHYLVLHILE
jgi:hypothetical protein